MKIKDLKDWLDTLTKEHDDCEIVFRKIIGKDNKDYMIAKDNSIDACGIDTDNNEAYFCDETTHNIIEKNS
jgi:hypothetical protein